MSAGTIQLELSKHNGVADGRWTATAMLYENAVADAEGATPLDAVILLAEVLLAQIDDAK